MNPTFPAASASPNVPASPQAAKMIASALQPNPILGREVRARWRTWPAFATVLCYALFLAGAVLYRYHGLMQNRYDIGQTATLGRELFGFMLQLQTLGWLLLAPLLTATSFTTERERGTMLSLHLSRLTSGQIAWGKWGSAAGFIGLLLFAPLPVMAVCFLLGGVSVWEFAASFALQAATASVGAAIGLSASARQHRAGAAIAIALFMVGLWNCVPPFFFVSPWVAARGLISAQSDFAAAFIIVMSLIIGPLATIFFVNEAASGLRKPLPPEATPNKVDPFSLPVTASHIEPQAHARGDLKRLPLVGRLSFDNPVLTRELRVKLQVREGSLGTRGHTPEILLWALGIFFGFFALFLIVGPRDVRSASWLMFSNSWLVAAVGAPALWAASAFTREREAGMLSSLRLSLLTSGDILRGKLFAPLFAFAYYSLALVPVLLPCVRGLHHGGRDASGVPLTQFAATLLLVIGAAWLSTCVGLLWSWLSRASWIAIAGSIGTLFLLFGGTLLLGPSVESVGRAWHPFFALNYANSSDQQWDALRIAARQCAFWLLLGSSALGLIWHGLSRKASFEASQTRGS